MKPLEELLEDYQLDPRLWARGRNALAFAALAGWAACAAGFFVDRAQFHVSYLVGFIFFTTIALGALFFVMLQHLTGAAWSITTRRTAENLMSTLPLAALLYLPAALGLHHLYAWTYIAIPEKEAFLNQPFFLVRAAVYFAVWSLLALKLYRLSAHQDRTGGLEPIRAAARWSGAGMALLTLTVCLAGFDWLMSLEPHWYSAIFGIYFYAGAGLAGFAALTVVLLALRRAGALRYSVHHEHYHDLGKWIFGLTVFWAYIAFCQYLLIWYANIPEETIWFKERLTGGWKEVSALLLLGHFFVPFFVLLSRAAKRRLGVLAATAAWVLLMHYVDLYWIVAPVFSKAGPRLHWLDAATLLALGGTFGLAFWSRLRGRALAPVGDERLDRALEFTNA